MLYRNVRLSTSWDLCNLSSISTVIWPQMNVLISLKPVGTQVICWGATFSKAPTSQNSWKGHRGDRAKCWSQETVTERVAADVAGSSIYPGLDFEIVALANTAFAFLLWSNVVLYMGQVDAESSTADSGSTHISSLAFVILHVTRAYCSLWQWNII